MKMLKAPTTALPRNPRFNVVATPDAPFTLDVRWETGRAYVPFVRRHLPRAHALLRSRLADLSLALVGDATMSRLHRQFLKKTGPTDVLTFELEHDAAGSVTSGEVVTCVPEAARQARRLGVSVERELLLYALHGMLHLSGFDDRTASEFRAMHRMEDDILTRLGLGATFAVAPRRRADLRGK